MSPLPPEPPPAGPTMRLLAWAVPLSILPSSLWRLASLAGVYGEGHPATEAARSDPAYLVALSVGTVLAGSLTIGLVRPWGVTFPGWAPWVGGRRVPLALAMVPALAGAAFGTLVSAYAIVNGLFHLVPPLNPQRQGMPLTGADLVLVDVLYLPLFFSGPLLGIVAFDYWRRRRLAEPPAGGQAVALR